MTDKTNHPIVFISYSWDTENGCNKHKEWVYKLATDLRHHGVDVILDQYGVRLGDDLPFFIEQGLSKSHLVLCICSENYVKKAPANVVENDRTLLKKEEERLQEINQKLNIK